MGLTYRSAGVDIEAADRAKRRIQELVRSTHTERVLTRPGLFGGALSLRGEVGGECAPRLCGALGWVEGAAAEAGAIVERCLHGLPAGARPAAFLDYLAAARMEEGVPERLVEAFAGRLAAAPAIPLIGGETAVMPGVLRPGAREVVGALFALSAGPAGASLAGAGELAHPCLVLSMDGVGTKTGLAVQAGRTGGLALDIIHHSLDDILCHGAQGLALLIYVGCHRREPAVLAPFEQTAREACRRLGLTVLQLAVVEKPEVYEPGQIDICAAIAGLGDAERLLQGDSVAAGDVLLGLASDGLHTNGYSLARRALLEAGGLKLEQHLPELGGTLADALLAPHRNYAPAVLPLLRAAAPAVRAVAHITGGGLADNLGRVIPEGLAARIRLGSWQVPPLFEAIRRCGEVPLHDPTGKGMFETFNMGIGLVLVVPRGREEEVRRSLQAAGERPVRLGEIRTREAGQARAILDE